MINFGYKVQIVRDPEWEHNKAIDDIIQNVTERFQRDIEKILAREQCDHSFATDTASGIKCCQHCGTVERYYHRERP